VSQLIEVAFKGNRREFFRWESDDAPARGAPVIVDADRGEDLGLVHSMGEEAERRSAKVPHGLFGAPPERIARRLAAPDEYRRLEELRATDDEARRRAAERVKANALVMKITDAEWQWDRKKLTFYFTAEKRVDFRTLVRELASTFRTRIELKQIGVRDEAKRLDGIGRCGRQYCSASWLPELRPVNLGVAKDQRLSLNPSQISGACGRLMCCLRYEHDFYVRSRRKYPKEGKVVRTSRGEEKVVANDIFRERVTMRGVEGDMRTVPVAELVAEMLTAGDPLGAALASAATTSDEAAHQHTDEHPVPLSFDGGYTDEFPVPVELIARHPTPRPERSERSERPAARPATRSAPAERAPRPSRPVPRQGGPAAAPATTVVPEPAPLAAGEPAPESGITAAGGESPLSADPDRRTQRRRGRRGGRRNRPSGERPVMPDPSTQPDSPPDGDDT
jgi:cell fate regulator YaaT (PSP1 superfamily)